MIPISANAYLLFARLQGETSLRLSLITEEYGRLSLGYKGGQKHLAHCRSFQPYHLLWTQSKQLEGGWCRQLEPTQYRPLLTGMANWSGLYANELVHRLLPLQQPNEMIFLAYHALIEHLHHTQNHHDPNYLAWQLRLFEWQLLAGLGYALPLYTDDGSLFEVSQHYVWQEERGWIISSGEAKLSVSGQVLHILAEGLTDDLNKSLANTLTQQHMTQQDVTQHHTMLVNNTKHLHSLRIFLQHRLALIAPNLPFSMRHWWEDLTHK